MMPTEDPHLPCDETEPDQIEPDATDTAEQQPAPGHSPSQTGGKGSVNAGSSGVRKGLVVIHGAGSERQSGTILFMGSPLIDWVRGWVEAHDRTLRVNQTALRFGSTDDDPQQPPPHVHITLGDVDDDCDSPVGADTSPEELTPKQQSIEPFDWIMTETWWAWSSNSPSLVEITMWLMHNFVRAIWAFGRAMGTHVRVLAREIRGPSANRAQWPALWLDWILTSAILVVSPAMVVLGFIGLIVVILLSQVPIQAVQDFALVGPVASFLTVNGGQMFTLANDEVQAANIRGRLERAIRFLQAQECKQIYVMAHSAGSVVSYETLCALGDIWQKQPDPGQPPVVKLFTMGEGLNLDWRLQPKKWWRHPHQWRLFMPLQESIHWVDFWAGQDPVPAGPVTVPERVLAQVRKLPQALQQSHRNMPPNQHRHQPKAGPMGPCEEVPVTNWMDILNDHGGYWDNDEEVLSRVACEIESRPSKEKADDWKESPFYETNYAKTGRAHRLARVGWLAGIRLTFYVLVVAALFEPRTYALGRAVLNALGSIPGISAIGSWANGAVSGATKTLNLSPTTPVVGPLGGAMDAVPALLVLLVLFILLYNVVARTVWQQWDVQMRLIRMRHAAGRQAEKWRAERKQAAEWEAGRQAPLDEAEEQKVTPAKVEMTKGYHLWLAGAVAIPVAAAVAGGVLLGLSFIVHAVLLFLGAVVPLPLLILALAEIVARVAARLRRRAPATQPQTEHGAGDKVAAPVTGAAPLRSDDEQ